MMEKVMVQRNPDFIFRKIVDESILVPLHKDVADMDCIYTLNSIGAFIWDLLEQPTTKAALQSALLDEYDAQPDVLNGDLEQFLEEMIAIGALVEVTA